MKKESLYLPEDLRPQKRGRRAYRFAQLLRSHISQFLLTGFKQAVLSPLVTVSHVIVSKDLREAKVYIRLPETPEIKEIPLENGDGDGEKEKTSPPLSCEETVETLNEYAFVFQSYLSHQLKSKFCPRIRFYKDDKTESILRIDAILHDNFQGKGA